MLIKYKQRCNHCKKNFVTTTSNQNYVLCYECQKDELVGVIKDKKMIKLFNIPEDFYRENLFLRNIKANYIKFGDLSEKQIEAFKKVVENIKKEKKVKQKS